MSVDATTTEQIGSPTPTILTGGIALAVLIPVALGLGKFLTKNISNISNRFVPNWIIIWLAISSLICTWDAMFVLNRATDIDSFNNPIWAPYQDYVKVDKLYGKLENDFVWSQSILNLLEIAINLVALYLLSVKKFKQAAVTALVVCAMTSSKTILYHTMEISCSGCNTKQNDWQTFVLLYVIPNGVWIWVPMYACIVLGKNLSEDVLVDLLMEEEEDSDEEEEDSDEEEDTVRGLCAVCSDPVYSSEKRGTDHRGNWYHEHCHLDMMNNQQEEDDDDDEEEEEEEEEVVAAPKKRATRAKSKGRAAAKSKSKSRSKKGTPTKKTQTKKSSKKSAKYLRTTTLVANLRDPDADADISLTLRPRHRKT